MNKVAKSKHSRSKAWSVDSETTLQVNHIATRYLELLGGTKSFNHRSAAFVPKQILASRGSGARPQARILTGSKTIPRSDHSVSEATVDSEVLRSALGERHGSVSRGVLMKGSTVTMDHQLRRKATHPFLPLRRKPPLPLYTRMHTALLLKRPRMRIRLRKVPRPTREEPAISLAPWTFEDKRGRNRLPESVL